MITEEEKIKTRKKILEASKKMFVEKGFEKTNLRNIAGEIGIGVSTIYGYFSSKQEIFIATFFSDLKKMDDVDYGIRSMDYGSLNLDNLSELLTFLFMFHFEEINKLDKDILKQFYCSFYLAEEIKEKEKTIASWEEGLKKKIMEILKNCEENNVFLLPINLGEATEVIYIIYESQIEDYIMKKSLTKENSRIKIKRLIKLFLLGKVKVKTSYDEFMKMFNKLDSN
ncbi:TetR/AcrR family transcriptional regulator [Anaerovirgula multivorans]|nr:TetR/AcrR family transcriptional regulator [Anaerovirgula multivorans]